MAKIMIIEDEKMFAKDLKIILEADGHKCTVYYNDDEVMENWTKISEFNVVILDLMMMRGKLRQIPPEQQDFETGEIIFNRLRADYPDTPIIVVTALVVESIQINFDQPIVNLISKPLNEDKLNQILAILNEVY